MAKRLRLIGATPTDSKRVYPRVHWRRGVRYVDGGTLLSTAALTAGVDATQHLLARRTPSSC